MLGEPIKHDGVPAPLLLTILGSAFVVSVFLTKASYSLALVLIITLTVFIVAFINTKASLYILIFSMLLSPEIMMSGVGGKEVAGRGVTMRLEDFLLVIIGGSWMAKSAIHKEIGLFLKTPLNRPILFYVVICFLSTGIGIVEGRVSMKTGFFFVLKYIEYYIIFFMVVNNIGSRRDIKHFLVAIFITCGIVCILGFLQISSGERVSAPFEGERGEPNTLGGYLVLIFSFAASFILCDSGSKKEKFLMITLCLLIVPPLLYTLSRSSWLSAVPMFMSLLFFSKKKVTLLLILIIGAGCAYFFMPDRVTARFKYTFREQRGFARNEKVGGVTLDPSTSERIHRFKKTLVNFKKNPILGGGVTGVGFIDGQYNRVLEETGLLGIIGFFWIILTIYKEAFHLYLRSNDAMYQGIGLGMIAGMTAMLTHAIGGNTFIIVRVMEPMWFLASLLISASFLKKRQEEPYAALQPIIPTAPLRKKYNFISSRKG